MKKKHKSYAKFTYNLGEEFRSSGKEYSNKL